MGVHAFKIIYFFNLVVRIKRFPNLSLFLLISYTFPIIFSGLIYQFVAWAEIKTRAANTVFNLQFDKILSDNTKSVSFLI